MRRHWLYSTTFSLALASVPGWAHDASAPAGSATPADAEAGAEQVEVHGERRGVDAASRIVVGRRELELRPRLRPADLVEAVPGLFAVQHAGGGKANQYFLRGFDADHGTDIAFFVDGVPVNMPSHAHGQGFADLHFVIPELVVGLEASKGPYYADLGNFATAGAVNLRLAETYGESMVQGTVGSFGVRRGLVIVSPSLGDDQHLVLAGEVAQQDGPFVLTENSSRTNLFAKYTRDLSAKSSLGITAMHYGSSWRASGQLPLRAVCGETEGTTSEASPAGTDCIPRFGYVNPSEGGQTARSSVSAHYTYIDDALRVKALAYAIAYDFRLHSDFTFFRDDPVNGDAIEQSDGRSIVGGSAEAQRHWHVFGAPLIARFGVDFRRDAIDAELWHNDRARQRLEARSRTRVTDSSSAAFAEADARLAAWLRVVAGVRAQRMDALVSDDLRAAGSGHDSAQMLLPKLSLIAEAADDVTLFASAGRGFHSNDARGAVLRQNPARYLTPAWGAEFGVRAKPEPWLTVYGAAFGLWLSSELVWSGDEGTTEAQGATRRIGVEAGARVQLSNVFFADVDATFTDAHFVQNAGNAGAVALAPTNTVTAGLGARQSFGLWSPFGALRVRHLGARPATEDGSLTAEGFTVVDANLGARYRFVEAALDVQNLFDVRWREVQFATTSRLPSEPVPVTGISMTPGWPRTLLARLALYVD